MFALGIVICRTGKSQRSQVFIMLEDAALRWPLEQCERVEAIGLRALEKIITTLSLNLENVVNWIKLLKSMGE